MRQFRDDAGIEWKVSLTPRGSDAVSRENYLPEAYREGWLVFESSQEKRRLAPVPPDWESLPVEELVRLCGKGVPQTARAKVPADAKVSAASPAPADALRPQLQKAEEQLDRTLEQVCETPSAARLDTGELIRVEESLALATEAAKEAVSLRRKMHADRDRATTRVGDAPSPPKEDGGQSAR
ncbi:MAG TPA: hypothetical protein VJW73_06595 [Gemmatimonadaceae bacterium]|nr:hypothetical protein [Gemmatimonadaceae bacterium]